MEAEVGRFESQEFIFYFVQKNPRGRAETARPTLRASASSEHHKGMTEKKKQ